MPTDSLRTRIAAVMERNLAEQLFSDLPDRYYKWIGYDELADAVIRELGLRRDPIDPFVNQLLFGDANSRKHRYVTDWIAND